MVSSQTLLLYSLTVILWLTYSDIGYTYSSCCEFWVHTYWMRDSPYIYSEEWKGLHWWMIMVQKCKTFNLWIRFKFIMIHAGSIFIPRVVPLCLYKEPQIQNQLKSTKDHNPKKPNSIPQSTINKQIYEKRCRITLWENIWYLPRALVFYGAIAVELIMNVWCDQGLRKFLMRLFLHPNSTPSLKNNSSYISCL